MAGERSSDELHSPEESFLANYLVRASLHESVGSGDFKQQEQAEEAPGITIVPDPGLGWTMAEIEQGNDREMTELEPVI